jgi:hypothetical protein
MCPPADPSPVLGPASLAAALAAAPASCGPVRLVAVDGHAGSGKTSFTAALAAELAGAPVVHLDDFATHESFFGWTGRLSEHLLAPLSRGRAARFTPYDWTRRAFPRPEEETASVRVPAAPVVLLEGVGAGRRALRPHLAALLWMDVPAVEAWRRGRHRDGTRLAGFWDAWTRAETTHFAEDDSYSYANYVVRRGAEGYEVFTGPAGRC